MNPRDHSSIGQNIIEEVSDLGQRSVSHLSELARVAGGAGAPVEFHWADPGEPQRRVILSSLVASRLQRVLTHIESSDEQIPMRSVAQQPNPTPPPRASPGWCAPDATPW